MGTDEEAGMGEDIADGGRQPLPPPINPLAQPFLEFISIIQVVGRESKVHPAF